MTVGEVRCRYQLPIVVIVFNNGGIYGGDRRQPALQEAARAGAAKGNFSLDPEPTAFVPGARCASY
jgi:2-hydroxyacyl-CoA lyase 1